jgi:hypothetical protein
MSEPLKALYVCIRKAEQRPLSEIVEPMQGFCAVVRARSLDGACEGCGETVTYDPHAERDVPRPYRMVCVPCALDIARNTGGPRQ